MCKHYSCDYGILFICTGTDSSQTDHRERDSLAGQRKKRDATSFIVFLNCICINFYLSLITDLLNTSRVMCFQKTVEIISRIIPWMNLINITVIFPLCLLSIMKNIKKDFFILSDKWEGLLKKNQLLFHLQRINKVLDVGDGISLQFYQGLPYQSHCFAGCSKTAFFLQLHM